MILGGAIYMLFRGGADFYLYFSVPSHFYNKVKDFYLFIFFYFYLQILNYPGGEDSHLKIKITGPYLL